METAWDASGSNFPNADRTANSFHEKAG
jgi:hypothetical protein